MENKQSNLIDTSKTIERQLRQRAASRRRFIEVLKVKGAGGGLSRFDLEFIRRFDRQRVMEF